MSPVFAFSAEQEEFRAMVRRFVEARSPEATVREQMATERGFDPAVWSEMSSQLGLQGLIVPEEFGGQGFGFVELTIVLEEMGRSLMCVPYFSTVVLAVHALLLADDDGAKRALLPGIAAGETTATLAFTEPNGRWDPSGIELIARRDGAGWKISGSKLYVLDGHTADVVLVAARTAAGVSLFSVAGGAAGLTRTPLATLDPTRKQARLDFDGVEATLVGSDGAGAGVLGAVLDLAAVALAARAGRWRAAMPRHGGRVRQAARAVRTPDRLVPGDQAQVRRHAPGGGVGPVGGLLRGVVAGDLGDELLAAAALAKAYCSEAYVHAASGEHPDPRGHRVHLGAPRASVLPAGEVHRAALRGPCVPS